MHNIKLPLLLKAHKADIPPNSIPPLILLNMSEGLIAEKPFQVLLMCSSIDHGDLAT